MKLLPHWAIPNKFPAVLETESMTVLEQTGRLYAAMQELIAEYNKYVDDLNSAIEDFENGTNQNIEDFKKCVADMLANHIKCMDIKMDLQNEQIANAVQYMKDNIRTVTFEAIETMFKNGEVTFAYRYDSANENLDMTINYGLVEGGGVTPNIETLETDEYNPETESLIVY